MIIIETLSLSDAFKYPFKTPTRLVYVLLLLIPILGWLVLFGYLVRLVNEFIDGRYEGLIKLEIVDDLKLGVITFVEGSSFLHRIYNCNIYCKLHKYISRKPD